MELDDDMFVVIVGEGEEVDTYNLQNLKQTVLKDKSDINIVKEENKESEYESVIDGTDDDETLPRYCDSDDHIKEKEGQRRSMLKPWQQKSFVQELKQQYPELKNNKKLLVDTLSEIMRSVKPPPPPQDYFVMNGCQFECVICGRMSVSIPAAGRHYQEYHGTRYLVCYACGVDFRSKTNLYRHEKQCSSRDAEIVLKARALFIGAKCRNRPFLPPPKEKTKPKKKASAPKTMLGCSLCSATFTSKDGLAAHENLHKGIRPYICPHCPAAYAARTALWRHIAKHRDIKFICDHCGLSFKVKDALIAHFNVHAPLKKYPCEECDKRFAQKSTLQSHIDRAHRNLPPPFKCQLCPRRYTRMSRLKAHMQKEHGMDIMTRKMFLKSLPMMSQEKLQDADLVIHSELLTNSNDSFKVCDNETEPEKPVVKSKAKTRSKKKAHTQKKETTIEIEIEEDVGSLQAIQTQNIESTDRLLDPSEIKEEHIMNSEEPGNDKGLHIENKQDDTKISNVDTKTKPLNMEVKKLTKAANKSRYSKGRNTLKRKFKN